MAKHHKPRKGLNNVLHGDRSDIRAAHKSGTPVKMPWENSSKHSSNSASSYKTTPSCYHSHPALKLPGSDKVVYGSNYQNPIVKDADIYISFQSGMPVWPGMPWERDAPIQIEAAIPDMGVPKDPEQFKTLVQWAKSEIDSGKKLHGACIGGHGRTGMFLAALVSLYGEPDAISYVRKNYCTKAVESKVQVEFLHHHFGITKVSGAKEGIGYGGGSSHQSVKSNPDVVHSTFSGQQFPYLSSQGQLWGK